MLSKYVKRFFASTDLAISASKRIKIEEAISTAFVPAHNQTEKALTNIHKGLPTVLFGGSVNHVVSLVIAEGKLIVFNRGEGSHGKNVNGKEDVAEFYDLPALDADKKMLESLMQTHPTMQAFNAMIKNLNLSQSNPSQSFPQKTQEIGNCSWASAKGVFGVLCSLYINAKGGMIFYKNFSNFVREEVLLEYCQTSPYLNQEILENIQTKCAKKSGMHATKALLKQLIN